MAKRRTKSNPRNGNSKMEDEEKKKKITTKKSVAMKSKASKENPLDNTIWPSRRTRSGMQRSDPSGSIEKREGTQLKECEQIGEQFDDLGEFAKAIVRFQRETQLQLDKKYNGEEEEEEDGFAIQGGGSFSERGDFGDIDMMSLEDDVHVNVDIDVDADANVDVLAEEDVDADANVNVVAEEDVEAEEDVDADANVNVDASVEADADDDANVNVDVSVEADADAEANVNVDVSVEADADAEANVNVDVSVEADSDADADACMEEDADEEANGTESIILSNMASPESSKQAVERTRGEKLSIQAASKNAPSVGLHISEQEDSNDSGGEAPNEFTKEMSNLSKKTQKTTKTRGPTKCSVFAMESESRIEVQLNSNGQPIEKPSEILSSYVGHLARIMVPITYNDWRKIPIERKEYYWHKIMQKFTFDGREEEAKTYTLQEMGKLWRSHKSRLGAKLGNKPHNIDSEEWQTFVQQRLSEKFKEKSSKFKEMRKKQSIPYTGSRKGFARMEDEIKKEGPVPESKLRLLAWIKGYTNKDGEATCPEAAELIKKAKELLASDVLESSPTSYVKDGALPHFIGPKRRSKVGGMAAKASPYLEKKIVSLNGKLDEMSSLVAKQKNLLDTLMNKQVHNQQQQVEHCVQNNHSRAPTTTPQVHNQQQEVEHCVQNKHSRAPATTPQSHDGRTNRVSRKCKLINWIVPDEIVAIGRWVSSDPKMVVHGVPLGRNASRVWIDEVEQPPTPLWRETSNMETMEEAMGSAIAWPTDHLIMLD